MKASRPLGGMAYAETRPPACETCAHPRDRDSGGIVGAVASVTSLSGQRRAKILSDRRPESRIRGIRAVSYGQRNDISGRTRRPLRYESLSSRGPTGPSDVAAANGETVRPARPRRRRGRRPRRGAARSGRQGRCSGSPTPRPPLGVVSGAVASAVVQRHGRQLAVATEPRSAASQKTSTSGGVV